MFIFSMVNLILMLSAASEEMQTYRPVEGNTRNGLRVCFGRTRKRYPALN